MIDDSALDAVCDIIASLDFDRTDLDEAQYRMLVEKLGQVECLLAATQHKLRESEVDRAQLATQLAVSDAKARAAARCVIAATAGDEWDDETTEYVWPMAGVS